MVLAYSINRVFLVELLYHNTLDTCSNMSKNAALKREQKKVNSLSVEREQGRPLGQPTNDKIQFSPRFTDFFHICLRTARNLTVVIVISFILSCYNLFICDRIMFIGCKNKQNSSYHQEKRIKKLMNLRNCFLTRLTR